MYLSTCWSRTFYNSQFVDRTDPFHLQYQKIIDCSIGLQGRGCHFTVWSMYFCVCMYVVVSLHCVLTTLRFQLVSSFPPCSLVRALVAFLESVWSSWLCKEEMHHYSCPCHIAICTLHIIHLHHIPLLTCVIYLQFL